MTTLEIVQRRLRNQRLTGSELRKPTDVVTWLGAIQAQEYAAAKWAIGLRMNGVTDADVEQAFNKGALLRTHFLRPTWHFVAPADIRWMLALSAPRVHAANAYIYRQFELDDRLLARSRTLLERALRDGHEQTRSELASMLRRAGIAADGIRLAYLVMHAELDAVICSGPRRGNQFTYALFDERVPPASTLKRNEALAKLTRRYFSSRGPATIHDFVWWSGLTVREAKIGLEETKAGLEHSTIDGRSYWFAESSAPRRSVAGSVYLLPTYDEFGIGYKDRGAMTWVPRPRGLAAAHEFANLLLIGGQLVGRWKRTVKPTTMLIEAQSFRSLNRNEERALAAAAERYGRFMRVPTTLSRVLNPAA
jgi:hypothetical protein